MPKEESVLLDKEQEKAGEVQEVKRSEVETEYQSLLLHKLEEKLTEREAEHPEIDNMPYSVYHEENEKMANTFIEPRENEEDTNYQTGTARDKMLALLAALNNLNLSPDISAFDKENLKMGSLGEIMEDTILKTEELDGDEEKKMLRQLEMLKQGEVYVEEVWDERWMYSKKIQKGGKFDGRMNVLVWTTKLKKLFSRPTRNILSGLSVVLGNIRQYDFKLQPYIFILEVEPFGDAEQKYGTWERWKNVPKTFSAPNWGTTEAPQTNDIWSRFSIEDGMAVIVRYQDPWNNEYAVMVNNVLLTPVGLPLDHVHGFAGFNVEKQVLEPISNKFAIGNSLMRKLRTKVGLLDEMIRLSVLKTHQSYKPPMVNTSGRILSKRIFHAGNVTNGADLAGKLKPLLDGQALGITQSEIAMTEQIRKDVDQSSVSPQFQGQRQQGEDPTATEVIELQRQAKLMLGLTIFACGLLEWKLAWLRLFNILAKWFDPYDTRVVDVRDELGNVQIDQETQKPVQKLENVYRRTVVERPVEGEGMGLRMAIPVEGDMPSDQDVKEAEDKMTEESGTPTRLKFLNPKLIKDSKLVWQIVIRPREKMTNEMSKLLFRAEVADAVNTFGTKVNLDYYAQIFASVWGRDPNKIFLKATPMEMQPTESAAPGEKKIPGVPSAESMSGFNRQIPKA